MKHVHFIGIGGAGLSAIAKVLLERGVLVTGSDRQPTALARLVQEAGGQVVIGHNPENLRGADLVVRSSAVPDTNVEVQAAREQGIPVLKRSEFVGRLMAGKLGIAVAGTHGKTTTTAMIAWMLTALGQDPSFIAGGVAANLGTNARAGDGPHFVIEADEYDRMFLGLDPAVIVVTNVEHDHPDYYPTPEEFFGAFVDFSRRLQPGGLLLACGDDPGARRLAKLALQAGRSVYLYGTGERSAADESEVHPSLSCDYLAQAVAPNNVGGFTFEVALPGARRQDHQDGLSLRAAAQVSLRVPGLHNVRNALAAIGVVHQLDLPVAEAARALDDFRGTGRRFEVRGEAAGVTVVDDYAHHPTAIRANLSAAQARYPGRRVWAVWQPHTYSRTRALYGDFLDAFAGAGRVLVTEIYAAREAAPEDGFSARKIVDDMQAKAEGTQQAVDFAPSLADARDILLKGVQRGDVVLVFSAGDADQVSAALLEGLKNRNGASHAVKPGQESQIDQSWRAKVDLSSLNIQKDVPLARYTSSRIGGPADGLLEVHSLETLLEAVQTLWEAEVPFTILGGGSNVLVSDAGVRGVVLVNRSRQVRFDETSTPPTVWADSGANFGLVARQAAQRGLSGLAWAGGIPGTVGGAVFGNAGAHDGDVAHNLILADILHRNAVVSPGESPIQRKQWTPEELGFAYRSSRLKNEKAGGGLRQSPQAVVLGALFRLENSSPQAVQAQMDAVVEHRKRTQPPGASMGSMFKNPPGDFAGRLIDAAGLKGARLGDAEISTLHANFFLNRGAARAADVISLLELAKKTVEERFGVRLELEIELVGDWSERQPAQAGG
jgi:UDP-N-acetylmuramate--alanine ligase